MIPSHSKTTVSGTLRVSRPTSLVACLCLLLLAGCSGDTNIDTAYGLRSGSEGAASVNGTSVFARMFEEAGFRVSTWKRMSPKLKEYDVIVWVPNDFDPPSRRHRDFFDNWLLTGHQRTLIYVGRDFDAAPG